MAKIALFGGFKGRSVFDRKFTEHQAARGILRSGMASRGAMRKLFIAACVLAAAAIGATEASAVESVYLLKGKTPVTIYFKDGTRITKKKFVRVKVKDGTYNGKSAWLLRLKRNEGDPKKVKKVCLNEYNLCNHNPEWNRIFFH